MINFVEFKNGVAICNTTPHPVTIQDIDGNLIEVPVPVPGYERVAPAEKRMRCDKFVAYRK